MIFKLHLQLVLFSDKSLNIHKGKYETGNKVKTHLHKIKVKLFQTELFLN